MIRLIPLAMCVPNSRGVYAVSKLEPIKELGIDDFKKYTPRSINVSFATDSTSNPQLMIAYGYGLDCWYLAEFS
jgi:hypothetical protein